MQIISMTASQAELVAGVTSEGNALQPVKYASDLFCLPTTVLTDVAHASKNELLKTFHVVEIEMEVLKAAIVANNPE